MTDAAIAADIHQTLDVKLDLCAEITLYLMVALDYLTNGCCLIVSPVFYFDVTVYTSLVKYRLGCAATDSEDIGQRYLSSFVLRQIYADNSYCHIALLQIFCKGNKIILDVV